MAKTSEELKKMINSTIYQNGAGQITGHGLNLILNELANGVSGGGGVGGGISLIIMDSLSTNSSGSIMPVLSKEGQEKNKKLYDMYISAMENGFIIPIYVDMSDILKLILGLLPSDGNNEVTKLVLKNMKQLAMLSPQHMCIHIENQTLAEYMVEGINYQLTEIGQPTITIDDIIGKYLILISNEGLGGLGGLGGSGDSSESSSFMMLLPNGLVVLGFALDNLM